MLQFERLKLFVLADPESYHLNETDEHFVSQFQSLRNKLVHVNYNFDSADLFDLNYDMIYVLVHIVPKLLAANEEQPSEYLKQLLGPDAFRPY
jgi:hypothetical protein